MRGFDVAQRTSAADLRLLRGLGFEVMLRYYRRDAGDPTQVTADELDTWLGLGGAILPIFEFTPTSLAYLTVSNGQADGAAARARAEGFGQPYLTPIVFVCADFDLGTDAASISALGDYLNGVDFSVQRRNAVWAYFGRGPLEATLHFGLIAGRHQAFAPTWSGGTNAGPSPYADVVQVRNGVTITGLPYVIDIDQLRTSAKLWRA